MKLKMFLEEGAERPMFYWPVIAPSNRYGYELWIFPLAGFVWLWYLLRELWWLTWHDMQRLVWMIRRTR